MQSSIEPGIAPLAEAGSDSELTALTLAEAAALIHSGQATATQLTAATLQRISAIDPALNSYITVTGEDAMVQARMLDAEAKTGRLRGPLHGIPIALKDNIDTTGVPTTAASAVYRDRIPHEDAEVTRRLKEAGAVIVGKLNLHEFAAGGTGHVSAFGATRNPWSTDHVPGGSSSGSGAAVAARLCCAALGTDTGGSVRIPSSWCGTVGLKPTYGLVSIRGIVPLIYSLDHCGPITRTVEDAAILLNELADYDPHDAASVNHPAEDYLKALAQPTESMRLGAPEEFYAGIDPEIAAAMAGAIEVLSTFTAGVVSRASLPPCGNLMHFLAETVCYHEKHLSDSADLYQPDTRRFLTRCEQPTAVEYVRAREELVALRRTIDAAFDGFDVVILPTERIFPFTLEEAIAQSMRAAETDGISAEQMVVAANTFPFNLYGIPALTLPCGFSKDGLPIGMTIAGPRFSEGRILALGAAYQRVTTWHLQRPALAPIDLQPRANGAAV